MNPNLGENFIVYSGRVSTYKCRDRWRKDEIVNVRIRDEAEYEEGDESASGSRSLGKKDATTTAADAHTTKIVGFYCRLKGFAVERIT